MFLLFLGTWGLSPTHFSSRLYVLTVLRRPPRGRFSHLAMFRIGSLLYIPAYLSVTLYRPLASAEEDGNLFLMIGEWLCEVLLLY